MNFPRNITDADEFFSEKEENGRGKIEIFPKLQSLYIGTISVSKKNQNPRRYAERRENRGTWVVTWAAHRQAEGSCLINALYHDQAEGDRW